ncbi:MAG: stage II sporulation protein P [Paenibacillaceae bacterium]|nr:stage II sporulation protein P [Paenibacillaceae bacterium]
MRPGRMIVLIIIVCVWGVWTVREAHPLERIPSTIWTNLLAAQWGAPSSRSIGATVLAYTLHIERSDVRTLLSGALAGGQADGDWIIAQPNTTPPIEVAPAPDLRLDAPPPAPTPQIRETNPVALIYHAHPYESYLPELPGVHSVDRAFDAIENGRTVTVLGASLAKQLTSFGIGSAHSAVPYSWKNAYRTARSTVIEAMKTHDSLTYLIDIHRDALRREKTTLTTKEHTYARIVFVIGQKNIDYSQNVRFATRLHERIERALPGISRGIILKRAGSHGEFNQSLSPNSVLIEIGGVDNTLIEAQRSIDVLASALRDIIIEDRGTIEKTL